MYVIHAGTIPGDCVIAPETNTQQLIPNAELSHSIDTTKTQSVKLLRSRARNAIVRRSADT